MLGKLGHLQKWLDFVPLLYSPGSTYNIKAPFLWWVSLEHSVLLLWAARIIFYQVRFLFDHSIALRIFFLWKNNFMVVWFFSMWGVVVRCRKPFPPCVRQMLSVVVELLRLRLFLKCFYIEFSVSFLIISGTSTCFSLCFLRSNLSIDRNVVAAQIRFSCYF